MPSSPSLPKRQTVIIHHLDQTWRRALAERLDPQLSVLREQRVSEVVWMCDPTSSFRYGSWLAAWRRRQWQKVGFLRSNNCEELSLLTAGLTHFDRLRKDLPPDRRDIGQYQSAMELFQVEAFLSDESARRVRRAEREQAYAESEMLFDQGRWKLVKLQSRFAATWWGMGTRWCTAARLSNHYDSYASRGQLLVILTPADKFQLFTGTGECCDSADRPVDLSLVLQGAPRELQTAIAPFLAPSL
ncbi:hypothetical protein [Devosia sediminis]|uniref:Uncharacterized protein n=1 Tax=Devosia sediminis TaxID=2798801 RepID=A0A934MMN1_9HYPH|nr:hypothetical protein [Devosia sediminis]MBJ3786390.1 hypothetical protein [Devosia sediminis]